MSQNVDLLKQFEFEHETQAATPVRDRGDALHRTPQLHFSQELMGLAQSVFLGGDPDSPRSVLFCGVDRENESSRLCFELGRLLAAFSGRSVCLIDGDVRESQLSQRIRETRIVIQNDTWRNGCTEIEPNLWIADADLMDPTRKGVLADTDALKRRLVELRRSFCFLLINAPGVSDRSDAGVLGQIVDGTVLVIEANSTRKAAALKAKKAFQAMNVRLLGTVLNNRTLLIPEKLYRIL